MSDSQCYVGIKSCGCAVAACVDRPELAKDTAKTIAKWIKDGLTIERKSVEWARANLFACKHESKQLALRADAISTDAAAAGSGTDALNTAKPRGDEPLEYFLDRDEHLCGEACKGEHD
jgi:hypothetical protein